MPANAGQRRALRRREWQPTPASPGQVPRIRRMPARNHERWNEVPGRLRDGEYIDSRIYSDREIFEEELTKIWKRSWMAVCHESEIPEPYDFRTTTVAREPIIVARGAGRPGARVPQRLSAPGQHHREPSRRELQGRVRIRRAEAHDVHVPRLAVRHEGQLRAHLAREGRLPEPALTQGCRAAPTALRGPLRRVRLGHPRRRDRKVRRGVGGAAASTA